MNTKMIFLLTLDGTRDRNGLGRERRGEPIDGLDGSTAATPKRSSAN